MAVDANVLIYERIREEMRGGKGLMVALKEGYSKAYSAIIDANLTTLLTAFVLYSFGSGAIRGFRHDADHRHLHLALQRNRDDAFDLLHSAWRTKRHLLLHRSDQKLVHQHRH